MSSHSQERRPRTTVAALQAMKGSGRRIVCVTAYDSSFARLADEAGVDVVLVGDSLGMTMLGHDSTLPVTMDDMLRHTAAVSRGCSSAAIVADMPFMSYQADASEALRNAGRFLAESGAQAVKLEGGRHAAPTVRRLVESGIPVMGHVGLTPQSVHAMSGYRVQARETVAALRLIDDCEALQEAGAFAVVLECIPAELALMATERLDIPTIGIGAGAGCDGEVQVMHDLLGLGTFTPKHARRYAGIGDAVLAALRGYAEDVRSKAFPAEANCTRMEPRVAEELRGALEDPRARGD